MKSPIFAVIAAKNEEKYISKVVNNTKKYVEDIIVVDDGSTDNTKKKAEDAGAIVLQHLVNLGKGAAVRTGCEYAVSKGADIIVLLDADGQHEPKDIPRFIEKLKGNEIVFGIRKVNQNMPPILKFGNWLLNKICFILYGIDIPDTQCGFRAFMADIYSKIRWKSSDYSMESEMVANVGKKRLKYSFIQIDTIYCDRYKGTTIIDGMKIAFNMLLWKLSR